MLAGGWPTRWAGIPAQREGRSGPAQRFLRARYRLAISELHALDGPPCQEHATKRQSNRLRDPTRKRWVSGEAGVIPALSRNCDVRALVRNEPGRPSFSVHRNPSRERSRDSDVHFHLTRRRGGFFDPRRGDSHAIRFRPACPTFGTVRPLLRIHETITVPARRGEPRSSHLLC